MAVWIFVAVVVSFASAAFCQYVAESRGHDSFVYFWVGFFLPVVGVLVAFLTPVPDSGERQRQRVESLAASTTEDSFVADLAEVARLHGEGMLSDDEFAEAKQRILARHREQQ